MDGMNYFVALDKTTRLSKKYKMQFSAKVMDRDSRMMRQSGPTIFAQTKNMVGIPEIADEILTAYREATKC
ncbi:hypothetical protein CHS0354_022864 [Potamilus streckersoni]|uniref:Uncharacterized protein n=1 Tax=Potamilus streckersoni TaxID=2493646 RepID=A0AAE0VNY1_9BIVA|nr:hypothetical protein CHS0354_022864 [Potamilus streckersoni]